MRTKKLIVGVTAGVSALSFLRGQLKWFTDNGWEVVLVSNPDEKAQEAAQREQVRLEGISMKREISVKTDFLALLKWIRLLHDERPTAVNVGTPKAGLLGTIAAFLTRVPKRLYIVRGLRLEGATGILFYVLWGIEKLTMLLATDVFFVSKSLAHEAKRLKLAPIGKSWLIGEGSSNGVPAELISRTVEHADRDQIIFELGIQPESFIVGFVGRINRDKGIELLIEALESSVLDTSVKVIFIGGIEESELTNSLNALGNQVFLLPWVENPWKYLSIIDLLCLPSLREGFPNVVLEAAAAGVPSIVTSATGAVDSVIDNETGMVLEERDANELAMKINSLIQNPDRLNDFGTKAKQRAFEVFHPEVIWKGLAEILEGRESFGLAYRPFVQSDK